jgi:hypothetical protein
MEISVPSQNFIQPTCATESKVTPEPLKKNTIYLSVVGEPTEDDLQKLKDIFSMKLAI